MAAEADPTTTLVTVTIPVHSKRQGWLPRNLERMIFIPEAVTLIPCLTLYSRGSEILKIIRRRKRKRRARKAGEITDTY